MSATGWMLCPKCGKPNPDNNGPDDEYYGATRIDFEHSCDKPSFSLRFWCTICGWAHEFTEKDLP